VASEHTYRPTPGGIARAKSAIICCVRTSVAVRW
jgi:hypothetical protein